MKLLNCFISFKRKAFDYFIYQNQWSLGRCPSTHSHDMIGMCVGKLFFCAIKSVFEIWLAWKPFSAKIIQALTFKQMVGHWLFCACTKWAWGICLYTNTFEVAIQLDVSGPQTENWNLLWSWKLVQVICFFWSRHESINTSAFRRFLPILHPKLSFFCLMICLAVSMEADIFSWSHWAPCLANISAFSFPGILLWPGIHWSVTLTLWAVMMLLMSCDRFLITKSFSLALSIAWSTDFASEKITRSVLGIVLFSKRAATKLILLLIAVASAS